ncbi:MAG: hypothetical protein ACT4N4_18145 [Rhodospirillales bacterium]
MEQLSTDSFAAVAAPNRAPNTDIGGEIGSPALRGLLAHWRQRRGKRAMPARGDLAEEVLTLALGEVVLFELSCAQTPRGDAGASATALTAGMAAPFHEVMRRGLPMYRRRAEPNGDVERLLLPLSRDGVRVDAILVGVQRRH